MFGPSSPSIPLDDSTTTSSILGSSSLQDLCILGGVWRFSFTSGTITFVLYNKQVLVIRTHFPPNRFGSLAIILLMAISKEYLFGDTNPNR
jgi:hypothetical protein